MVKRNRLIWGALVGREDDVFSCFDWDNRARSGTTNIRIMFQLQVDDKLSKIFLRIWRVSVLKEQRLVAIKEIHKRTGSQTVQGKGFGGVSLEERGSSHGVFAIDSFRNVPNRRFGVDVGFVIIKKEK
jgi:hypothetical protein